MKKLLLFILLGVCTFVNAQDVKVDINRNDVSSKKDCPFAINGICSTEDVGGVDTQVLYKDDSNSTYLVFTNYNSQPVTVTYMIGNNCDTGNWYQTEYTADGSTGTLFLKQNETKTINIARHDRTRCFFVSGLIVRFLK